MRGRMDAELGLDTADWSLIRAFVEVVRSGNLSAAARNLGQTQPTLGRQIRRLEAICGEPLFLRRGREFEPTERARGLYDAADALEPEVTALSRAFAAPATEGPGVVRISTVQAFASTFLPELLPPLLAADPGLEIEVLASERLDNLVRRDADLAIRFVRPTQPELIAAKLGEIPLGLYAAPELIERQGAPESFADLAGWPWVCDREGRELADFAAGLGVVIPHARMRIRTDHIATRAAAIRAGLGVGAMVVPLAEQEPGLRRLLPEIVVESLPAWIVAHDDLNRTPRLRFVFDHLRTAIRALMAQED